jgi:hypothetical protein
MLIPIELPLVARIQRQRVEHRFGPDANGAIGLD